MLERKSRIIDLIDPNQAQHIIVAPPTHRIVGRTVDEWSPYCGTYGMGGPGFFGLRLCASGEYPEEWLMFRLWCAPHWLTVNDRWLEAHPQQYDAEHRPMYSNYQGYEWDELSPLILGRTIDRFFVDRRTTEVVIGSARIQLSDDPSRRPPHQGTGQARVLFDDDDLQRAWIIAPWPQVVV